MATFFPYFLGQIPLTEHRVAGDQLAFQGNQIQQLQRRLVLVGLGVDGNLIQHHLRFVGVGGQQMNPRHLVTLGTTQGLAVEGHRLPTRCGASRRPATNGFFKGPAIQRREQVVQGRATRRNVSREPQRRSEGFPPIPPKLRDGVQTPRPRKNRHRRERQNGWQWMTPSLGVPWIGHLCKRFPKRNNS